MNNVFSVKLHKVGVTYFFCSISVAAGKKFAKPIKINPNNILEHKYISGQIAVKSLHEIV